MDAEKHTPTPFSIWFSRKRGAFFEAVIRSDKKGQEQDVATAFGATKAQAEANAAFIVRACNSHGALVDALEKCHAALQQFAVHNAEKEAMAEARAALKQAKENA